MDRVGTGRLIRGLALWCNGLDRFCARDIAAFQWKRLAHGVNASRPLFLDRLEIYSVLQK